MRLRTAAASILPGYLLKVWIILCARPRYLGLAGSRRDALLRFVMTLGLRMCHISGRQHLLPLPHTVQGVRGLSSSLSMQVGMAQFPTCRSFALPATCIAAYSGSGGAPVASRMPRCAGYCFSAVFLNIAEWFAAPEHRPPFPA